MPDARWLDPESAAKYLSVRVDALPRLVRQGRIHEPHRDLGERSPRWDRLALDAVFDGGTASTNSRTAVEALAREIEEKGRSHRPAHAG